MTWVAAAVIGGAVISGVASSSAADVQAGAAKSAADASAAANKYATDVQKQIYDQTRADQMPWRQGGANALNALLYGSGLPTSDVNFSTLPVKSYDQYRSELLPQFTSAGSYGSYSGSPSGGGPGITAYGPLATLPGDSSSGYQSQSINEAALNAEINRRMIADQQQSQQSQSQSGPVDYSSTGLTSGSLLRPFGMSDFQVDPGYAFRLSEGMKALDRTAAARGGLLSGATLKGAEAYNQGLASDEYQNAYNRYQTNQGNQFNRLASIAGVGQTANSALQQAGSQYGSAVGNLAMTNAANQGNALMAAGNARASAYQGYGNAIGNVLGNTSVQNALSSWGSGGGTSGSTGSWGSLQGGGLTY